MAKSKQRKRQADRCTVVGCRGTDWQERHPEQPTFLNNFWAFLLYLPVTVVLLATGPVGFVAQVFANEFGFFIVAFAFSRI